MYYIRCTKVICRIVLVVFGSTSSISYIYVPDATSLLCFGAPDVACSPRARWNGARVARSHFRWHPWALDIKQSEVVYEARRILGTFFFFFFPKKGQERRCFLLLLFFGLGG